MEPNPILEELKFMALLGYSHERYAKLIDEVVANIKSLSALKGGEYAGDVDRLANFRRNGEKLELPMEVIWNVYCNKHWDAIQQYVLDIKNGKERTRAEPIEGRIDDAIVYLILLRAMVDERNSK
jgi:hypothetical protein